MKADFKSAMLAAAQLTAAGNLHAATAAIQRALAGELPAATAHAPGTWRTGAGAGFTSAGDAGDVIDVLARWLPDSAEGVTLPEAAGATTSFFRTPQWHARADGATMPAPGFKQADPPPAAVPQAKDVDGARDRMLAGTFSAPAGSRDYLLYVPSGTASTVGHGLVVMLHGCTQTPSDFAAGTAMNRLADQHGFVVLYPGQSRGANQSACWNWFNPRDQRANAGEPSIIAGMVREVIARHSIDPGRVHVAGLSAGGAMAAILAQAYPDLFSAVAVHSGLASGSAHDLPSALAAMKRGAAAVPAADAAPATRPRGKPVRTIVFHGRQDRTVHPSNGSQVVEDALAAWGADTLAVSREGGRSPGGRSFARTVHADAAGKPMVEHWEVKGAGHAWSGGSASGSYTDPSGPDASAAMVAFFLAR